MTPREAQEKMQEFARQRERDENLRCLAKSAEEQVSLARQEANFQALGNLSFTKALLVSAGSLVVAIIALAIR